MAIYHVYVMPYQAASAIVVSTIAGSPESAKKIIQAGAYGKCRILDVKKIKAL